MMGKCLTVRDLPSDRFPSPFANEQAAGLQTAGPCHPTFADY